MCPASSTLFPPASRDSDTQHVCAEGLTFTGAGESAHTMQPKAEPREEAPADRIAKPASSQGLHTPAASLWPTLDCAQRSSPSRRQTSLRAPFSLRRSQRGRRRQLVVD